MTGSSIRAERAYEEERPRRTQRALMHWYPVTEMRAIREMEPETRSASHTRGDAHD